jgi:hypothetical protein
MQTVELGYATANFRFAKYLTQIHSPDDLVIAFFCGTMKKMEVLSVAYRGSAMLAAVK